MNQSPGSIITKMPSMRKLGQNNPNPSSMFTPGHYDYSNNSEISFCIDDNMTELKGTYIVLYFFFYSIFLMKNLSLIWIFLIKLIKYRCMVDLFEIFASVPIYHQSMKI